MKYIIIDNIAKTYVSYGEISSDCWSTIRDNANTYNTLKQARKVASYIAKICKIKRNDLVIETL